MTAHLRVRAMFVVAMMNFAPMAVAQDLPPEVQIDMAMAALERAMLAGDDGEILERIGALRDLAPELAGGDLLFFEATALAGQGDIEEAEQVLNRFLSEVGQQSASYEDALALMLDIPALRQAKAEADRIAAAERQAEEQRRREEAAQAEEERLRAGEAALNLTSAEIRHIRWLLYRHAGEVRMPVLVRELSDAERDYLEEHYLPDVGLPAARYLTAVHARHFRSQVFVPVPPDEASDPVRTVTSGDWTMIEDQRFCWIETPASDFTRGAVYQHPVFKMIVERPRYEMGFDTNIVLPHPFDESRGVNATINGRTFPLSFVNGRVWPFAPGASPTTNAVHKAIRAAESVTIEGTSSATGQTMTVSYSAIGFTRAFYLMTEYCNREELQVWIE
ncbi:hypothetical protein [Devosia sp.]|uniref:hypothetical protein n=1 Tax=Devosia sp. TaxID=1871048 RepID=UPI002734FB9F|nr:hypothetical protein [Devosia sp.]MDP2781897.1 hypothetical protein [Devosia sp.]